MKRMITPVLDVRQRPVSPSPTGRAATEDEGQRILEDTSEAQLSDKNPAGRLPYSVENDADTQNSAGRDRSTGCSEAPSPSVEQHHDSQVNTGHDDVSLMVASEAPVEPRNSRRRDVSLDVRLTVNDRDAIRRRAQVLSVKPSAWARAVLLDALDARSAKVDSIEACVGSSSAQSSTSAPAVEQLRRVGVNLNQVLRKGDCVEEPLLREVIVAVDALRASLGDRTRT